MKSDCYHEANNLAGFIGSHNHRCSRGLTSPDVHLGASHHVRVSGWCGRVCDSCARDLGRRNGAIVRELEPAELQDDRKDLEITLIEQTVTAREFPAVKT